MLAGIKPYTALGVSNKPQATKPPAKERLCEVASNALEDTSVAIESPHDIFMQRLREMFPTVADDPRQKLPRRGRLTPLRCR